ncbi:MAG: HAD-IA family hydrolase [Candidatus Limnocylindrales bacterium]
MTPIKAVLFDWGDTLFYSPRADEVIVAYGREHGVTVTSEAAAALWTRFWDAGKTPEEHAKGRDLSEAAHRSVWTALFAPADDLVPGLAHALYEQVMHPSTWRPYSDTEWILRQLRARGLKIGIVSNIAFDLRPLFAVHGLRDLIDTYALSFEHGVAKPALELFKAACAALGIMPAQTLMVGDDPVTDGAAIHAGCQVHILVAPNAQALHEWESVLRLIDLSSDRSSEW